MQRTRRGSIAVIVALVVAVLAGFVALVLDLGYARLIQTQLRMSTDAAALAAVQQLDDTEAGMDNARAAAVTMAGVNLVAGEALAIASDDVEFGSFDEGIGFTVNDDPTEINAVRIASEAQVPFLISVVPKAVYGATGSTEIALSRSSLVVSEDGDDAGAVDCFLPFALGLCSVSSMGLASVGGEVWDASSYAGLSSGGANRQMFMAAPGGTSTFNNLRYRSQLSNCTAWGDLTIGDTVALHTGTNNTGSFDTTWHTNFVRTASAVNASTTSWDSDLYGAQPAQISGSAIGTYGKTLEGPIPVVTGSSLCTATNAVNSPGVVVGFLWAAVYDVKLPASSGAYNLASAGRVRLHIDTDGEHEYGTESGGPGWDVVMTPDQVRFIEDPSL